MWSKEKKEGPMVLLVGPSGAGKSTFVDRATSDFKNLVDIITYTTRPMREGESEGHPYHFVSDEEFKQKVKRGDFVEWAEVHGKCYGSPRDQIEKAWEQGKAVIMDVDVQGAKKIKQEYPHSLTIFILPPSIDELRQRVIRREGKPPADLELRMSNAVREIKEANAFDRQVVNSDFEVAYSQIKKMIEDLIQKG
ncbi:MAG: guanylate kinase [Bdellovibrio sp.]|nr:MAG: guanylate kinase [Bdellovibrio sp.]